MVKIKAENMQQEKLGNKYGRGKMNC